MRHQGRCRNGALISTGIADKERYLKAEIVVFGGEGTCSKVYTTLSVAFARDLSVHLAQHPIKTKNPINFFLAWVGNHRTKIRGLNYLLCIMNEQGAIFMIPSNMD